jgi:hypothetical protein
MFDKEIIRSYLKSQNFSGEGKVPQIPKDKVIKTLQAYAKVYLNLTTEATQLDFSPTKLSKRIKQSLQLSSNFTC